MSHHQSAKAVAVIEVETTSDVAISFAHSQYDTNALPVGFVAALYHPLNWYVTPELTCTTSELIHHPAKGRMLPVLVLDPSIRPATAVDAVTVLGWLMRIRAVSVNVTVDAGPSIRTLPPGGG